MPQNILHVVPQAPAAPLPPPEDVADPPGLARTSEWWAALRCVVLLAALNPGSLAAAVADEARLPCCVWSLN